MLAGPQADAGTAEAALAMNARLGALGHTLELIEPPDAQTVDGTLADLVAAVGRREVRHLISLTEDPLATAPGDVDAAGAFAALDHLWHLSLYPDRTAAGAEWHIPRAHALESWGDLAGHDGTIGLQQPLIDPLSGGRTPQRLLAWLMGVFDPDERAMLAQSHGLDAASFAEALRRGTVEGSAAQPVEVALDGERSPSARGGGAGDGAAFRRRSLAARRRAGAVGDASGTATAADQAGLGQRPVDRPGRRGGARARQWRRGDAGGRRPRAGGTGLDRPRPSRGQPDPDARPRPDRRRRRRSGVASTPIRCGPERAGPLPG